MAYLDGEFHELFVAPLLRSRIVAAGQVRPFAGLSLRDIDALTQVHPRIQAPVRLIWGAKDRFFPLRHAREMVRQFGGPTDLREIADGKLFAHEDRPEEFVAHARPFLREHLGERLAHRR